MGDSKLTTFYIPYFLIGTKKTRRKSRRVCSRIKKTIKLYRSKAQRKDDLLERFIRGKMDEEVRFFVNYIKTPNGIDEAVHAVVECMSKRQTSKYRDPSNERKMKKHVRRACSCDEDMKVIQSMNLRRKLKKRLFD